MAPDNERLGRLIGAAFEQLPEPVPARLKAVEDRLALNLARRERRSRPGWYWWLMAALIASGAAAWWSGTAWRSGQDKRDVSHGKAVETIPSNRAQGSQSTPGADGAPAATGAKRSPTIYRRERP